MMPSVQTAEKELELAGSMNPGPWVGHSRNVGVAARNIAEKVPGMDPEKAYIVGLLHDIGRRVGVVDITTHVLEGYRYCTEQGWEEAARICMTHSYPLGAQELGTGDRERIIRDYLAACAYDDVDRLIVLCDSLAVDYGFCILERRFVDVARRYGIWPNTVERWNETFRIKEDFERRMGCSVYDVLPNIGRTTLLSPPPWKPSVSRGEKTE